MLFRVNNLTCRGHPCGILGKSASAILMALAALACRCAVKSHKAVFSKGPLSTVCGCVASLEVSFGTPCWGTPLIKTEMSLFIAVERGLHSGL